MATTNSRRLNSKLAKLYHGLKIYAGRGYVYFTCTREDEFFELHYDTRSVYVNRMADLTEDEWLVEARAFLADLGLPRSS